MVGSTGGRPQLIVTLAGRFILQSLLGILGWALGTPHPSLQASSRGGVDHEEAVPLAAN